jgi:hypothetical protein
MWVKISKRRGRAVGCGELANRIGCDGCGSYLNASYDTAENQFRIVFCNKKRA